jgi:hypothetical protein
VGEFAFCPARYSYSQFYYRFVFHPSRHWLKVYRRMSAAVLLASMFSRVVFLLNLQFEYRFNVGTSTSDWAFTSFTLDQHRCRTLQNVVMGLIYSNNDGYNRYIMCASMHAFKHLLSNV